MATFLLSGNASSQKDQVASKGIEAVLPVGEMGLLSEVIEESGGIIEDHEGSGLSRAILYD